MNKVKPTLNNASGFSLIELMVVVAIIGILATIAVPNFQRFSNKAKQTEARTSLAAVYGAQMAFSAEWGHFHSRFGDIGFVPTGRINYGVSLADADVTITGYTNLTSGPGTGSKCISTQSSCTIPASRSTTHTVTAGDKLERNTFKARASAQILKAGKGETSTADTWTINEQKELENTIAGI